MTERDTHFQGAARLLWIRLRAETMLGSKRTVAEQGKAMEHIIAQFCYDFAYHTLSNTTQAMAAECEHRPAIAENLLAIPDLTEWPK